ncbi:hypothetical protein DUNSADRAFT_15207 [Dunaliella salina]|uniref:Encoded protein n=1 Tax=Dunaliella salina TaxID=3046 RepID=A0ABQ7G5T4_DUNSA|nr:hypothetical protein DUNSADRAFT_15207 [Dunaliella salina]|eukprot:KAF5829971.1 hypothetical protein DUNSADRAFT_15207 [Dunaliella salina]
MGSRTRCMPGGVRDTNCCSPLSDIRMVVSNCWTSNRPANSSSKHRISNSDLSSLPKRPWINNSLTSKHTLGDTFLMKRASLARETADSSGLLKPPERQAFSSSKVSRAGSDTSSSSCTYISLKSNAVVLRFG